MVHSKRDEVVARGQGHTTLASDGSGVGATQADVHLRIRQGHRIRDTRGNSAHVAEPVPGCVARDPDPLAIDTLRGPERSLLSRLQFSERT